MPDDAFEDLRLAQLYDLFDDDRSDLDHYVAMVDEFGAQSVLDVGSGTGAFGALLAAKGIAVHGAEPALGMFTVAQQNHRLPGLVWHNACAHALPADLRVDMALMTGNVAQVFVDDADWARTLKAIRHRIKPGGLFVFETRDPAQRAWESWTRKLRTVVRTHPTHGTIEYSVDVTEVALPLVTFMAEYRFVDQGVTLHSRSTLRFRSSEELDASLTLAGFEVLEVRDALDRPLLEWVYIARVLPK